MFEQHEKDHNLYRTIEIEIKTSWSDFLADFKHKQDKHILLKTCPYVNYFAFCVPLEIYDKCREFLNKFYPQYGLFIYDPYDSSVCQSLGSQFARKKLLTEKESTITKENIVKQMAIHIIYKN